MSPETNIPKSLEHHGESYITVLDRIHRLLSPKSYLEIGTQAGQSLAIARCPSIAIDPDFQISANVFTGKGACHLFQTGSDEFFQKHDPTDILKKRLDFVFLDGMHWFEFLLRDFSNCERHCAPNSVIAIHDCIPLDLFSTRRDIHDLTGIEGSSHPEWWTGDVWKVIRILQKYRPDLKILALDAPPTGLILITKLDPGNMALSDGYFQIVEEALDERLTESGLSDYVASLAVQSTRSLSTRSQLSEHFWF